MIILYYSFKDRVMSKNRIGLVAAVILILSAPVSRAADGYGASATGGAGGTAVTVTTAADLLLYAQNSGTTPYIITIGSSFTITGSGNGTSGGSCKVRSNKTIQGLPGVVITGSFAVDSGSINNVIIQNLTITNPRINGVGIGTGDGITVRNSATNIFITHCSFVDCADGSCDISLACEGVTVSWCKFSYPTQVDHCFTMISGDASETSDTKQHITLHHNWWAAGCNSRMPSGSHCNVHMYNNYFNCVGDFYCSNGRVGSQMLSQNNYYDGVKSPCYVESGGLLQSSGNDYHNCTGTISPGTDTVFVPPYAYTVQPTADVPASVTASAGATLAWVCGGTLVSDLDSDCQVTFADFAWLANAWAGGQPAVDLNADSSLNWLDVQTFCSQWLSCLRLPSDQCWQ
jgi:pectate lyase